jgi:ABC-2 type transport system ATP-binding protein
MPDAAIEAVGLAKRFKAVEALRGIGFAVEAGRSLALVGPDGAGKTTAMRLACGLLEPDAGEVRIFGEAPSSPRSKARIGYLSQRFSLYADLSVDENIAFFAEIHGRRDYGARRDRLLDFTRLTPFRTRQAGRLSGGMRQKLALACALVHEPRILLMDEPTTGVDPVSRREFWAIIAELGRDGMTVVAATPYLDEAERFDAVGFLNKGRFLALDSPRALKEGFEWEIVEMVCPDARRAAALVGARDFLGREESGGIAAAQAFGDRIALLARDGKAAMAAAVSALASAGVEVSSSRLTEPSLENVFMELLGGME